MARDISIAISARDNFTQAVTTMRNANTGFNKDLEETGRRVLALEQRQKSLGDSLSKSQTSLTAATNALKDAKRAFSDLSDETNRTNLEKAYSEYNRAKEEVKGWGGAIKDTQKAMKELYDEQSRQENRAGGMSGSGSGGMADVQSALAGAGLGKMVGDSLTGALNTGISSAFGSNLGGAISTTISGALTGAAMGSIAGPVGAAVGAGVGLVAGGISAATGMFAKEDDAFIAVRNEMVENALQSQRDTLSTGIDVAMGRQKTNVQLRHQFGDEELAEEYLQNTIALANQTPFFYTDLVGVGSTYKAFGFQNDELYEEQLRIANAAAIRGWDASGMEQIASNLGFMRQSGKIDTMRVKQLQMAGLNVPRYLAIAGSEELFGGKFLDELTGAERLAMEEEIRALMGASDEELQARGVTLTEDDIYAMIAKGEIDGKQAARAISNYMAIEFEGGAGKLAETYYGLSSTLSGLEQEMQNAMGEGYTAEREKGIRDQIEYFSGDQGESLQEAYGMIGQWEASLENSKERMERDIMTAVMSGNTATLESSEDYTEEQMERIARLAAEYQSSLASDSEDAGNEMGRILAEAQTEAQMAYNASDGARQQLEMHQTLIDDVSSALVKDRTYWDAGFLLGEEMSKGMAAAMEGGIAEAIPDPRQWSQNRFRNYATTGSFDPPGNAWGIPYVPYDDYVTRLHQGERVLTAQEARSAGQPISVSISGNEFIVRQESDIDAIAQALAEKLRRAQQVS